MVQPSCAQAPRLPCPGRAAENAPRVPGLPRRVLLGGKSQLQWRPWPPDRDHRGHSRFGYGSPRPAGVCSREGPPTHSPRPGKDCAAPGTFRTRPAPRERAGSRWSRARAENETAGRVAAALSPAPRAVRGANENLWPCGDQHLTGFPNKRPRSFTCALVHTHAYTDAHANPVSFALRRANSHPRVRSHSRAHGAQACACPPLRSLTRTQSPQELQFAPTRTHVHTSHADLSSHIAQLTPAPPACTQIGRAHV